MGSTREISASPFACRHETLRSRGNTGAALTTASLSRRAGARVPPDALVRELRQEFERVPIQTQLIVAPQLDFTPLLAQKAQPD
jgi:hypothetical protein